jgi:hypothetical protein
MGMRRYEHTCARLAGRRLSHMLFIDTVIRLRILCNSMGLTLFRLGLRNIFSLFPNLVVQLFLCLTALAVI